MCLIDVKEMQRVARTHDNLKELHVFANLIIRRLVDEGFVIVLSDIDPFAYPCIDAYKKEVL